MFQKIENSWKLAKECWRVLMLDKEMLMFPLLSTVVSMAAMALVAWPMWASGYFSQPEVIHIDTSSIIDIATILKMLVFFIVPSFICYLTITFFNSGLVTCAFIRLCGDDPVLADGFRVAFKRLPQIFAWAAIATTVGLLLRMVRNRDGLLSSTLGGLIGLGWRVASFFVIPVIVAEEKGAFDSLKRSSELIKKNWGEALTLEVGFSVLVLPAMVPAVALFAVAVSLIESVPALGFFLIVLGVLAVFLVSLVFATLDAIAKAALYMYASGNQMPENFNSEILGNIFKRTNSERPALA